MADEFPRFSDPEILALRPKRNAVNARRPYAFLVEPECNAQGQVVGVATVFLTNRECPFRCLMCDLWKNTLTESVSRGDVPEQIRWALRRMPPARQIKLYNNGNFFDSNAIPTADYGPIAELVRHFETVIVENHPRLCGSRCQRFRDLIAPAQLEVALGLETCHPELLATLNKRMTLEDFDRAAKELMADGIHTRVFLLLKPPFLDESEAVDWAAKSIDYAFDRGVQCCVVIPTRAGNGMLDQLSRDGRFSPPSGRSLERVLELGLVTNRGRVFVDLWDAAPFFHCNHCRGDRIARLNEMNLRQTVLPPVACAECRP
jgi:hypothetical protein